ncbi:hypothetical protein [Lacticaseibacillus thailandensis]|uniref:Uncharacterized protein n=1 Tax=Lacticaseibacillus thailandensis DSM 22698 = JCM 13996 TaxID=1423810 RepID=A0A0R2CDG6_9LACO|nr:hypothetical protein [Lacticaseibacillus thailandensis]KRM86425.1 hypothetical protein FD19_GL000753 [Lacticaseibacillus thailandensis DSM 22698 = JCM 13996]
MSITDEFIAAITADVALQLDAITQLGQQVAHRVVARQQQEGTTEQDIDVTLTGLTITLHPTPNIDAFMADHPFVQLAAQPGIQGNDHEQTLTVETAKFGVIELRRAADPSTVRVEFHSLSPHMWQRVSHNMVWEARLTVPVHEITDGDNNLIATVFPPNQHPHFID